MTRSISRSLGGWHVITNMNSISKLVVFARCGASNSFSPLFFLDPILPEACLERAKVLTPSPSNNFWSYLRHIVFRRFSFLFFTHFPTELGKRTWKLLFLILFSKSMCCDSLCPFDFGGALDQKVLIYLRLGIYLSTKSKLIFFTGGLKTHRMKIHRKKK